MSIQFPLNQLLCINPANINIESSLANNWFEFNSSALRFNYPPESRHWEAIILTTPKWNTNRILLLQTISFCNLIVLLGWLEYFFYLKYHQDIQFWAYHNKANLRDLIAATGLVILLKFDPNHRFFVPCDLEIWWMTLENKRAPLLYYTKLCLSFQIRWWIETEVTVRKRSIQVKIGDFLSCVTLKFDGWPWKTTGHLFCVASSFVHHFTAISQFKLELQSGNPQFWSKSTIFLAMWPRNFTDDPQKQ